MTLDGTHGLLVKYGLEVFPKIEPSSCPSLRYGKTVEMRSSYAQSRVLCFEQQISHFYCTLFKSAVLQMNEFSCCGCLCDLSAGFSGHCCCSGDCDFPPCRDRGLDMSFQEGCSSLETRMLRHGGHCFVDCSEEFRVWEGCCPLGHFVQMP